MKIVVNLKFKELQPFIENLPFVFDKSGEIIYTGRNQLRTYNVKGYDIVVKSFGVPHLINCIAYTFFRKSKAKRSYKHALILLEKGINTPEPIAYIEEKKGGLFNRSYYISEQLNFNHNFYDISDKSSPECEIITCAFVRFIADIHEKKVLHKDLSPGNVLYDIVDGKPVFSLVDINRMDFGEVNMDKGCANFARLWGNTAFFKLIANEYASCRQYPQKECEQLVLKYRHKFWIKKDKNRLKD